MLEDELLKWKLRRGSPEALARVYEKYIDAMLTLALGLLGNRPAAEDVVQDVFLSFARSARGLRAQGSLCSYLATGVLNRVRDRLRHPPITPSPKAGPPKARPFSCAPHLPPVPFRPRRIKCPPRALYRVRMIILETAPAGRRCSRTECRNAEIL
jgi:hypothetical protein